jgi:exopolysaccharide biosynthesis polyprenyl glycosylphosphotransferase
MYEVSNGEFGADRSAGKTTGAGTAAQGSLVGRSPSGGNTAGPNRGGGANGSGRLFAWLGPGLQRSAADAASGVGGRPVQQFALSPGFTATLNSLVDLGCLLASIIVSTALSGRPTGVHFPVFVFSTVASGLVWIVAAAVLRHYEPRAFERAAEEDAALVSILVMAVTTFLAVVNLVVDEPAAVPKVPQFLVVFWPVALFLRLFVFRAISEQESPLEEALIIGTGSLGRLTGEDLERRGRHCVVGYLQFTGEVSSGALNSKFLGTCEELEKVLRSRAVSEVYIAGDATKNADAMQAAIRVCERLGVPFALPAYHFRFERARPVPAASKAVADGYLHYLSVELKPRQMALKRLFDIVSASVVLALLLPLFALLAVLIKLTSSGPVFFRQVRIGLHGRPFHMLKFRSMVVNAEELKELLKKKNERTGPVFKIRNDPRITSIGKLMRNYSLDELPQLINVLRGEMSVVGPRPPVPSEVDLYEPWQRRRLAVRPGLTCIWQTRTDRHQISFEEWMYLDMQYIDHWSLARDFALIFKTLPVVLTGAGER